MKCWLCGSEMKLVRQGVWECDCDKRRISK